MKNTFLKALLAAGAILIAWNCSDESTTAPKAPEYAVTSAAWLLSTDADYIIYPDGRVTNPEGDVIATINYIAGSTIGNIVDLQGVVLVEGVDVMNLPLLEKNTTVYAITGPAFHLVDETGDYLIYPAAEGMVYGVVTDSNGATVGFFDYSTNTLVDLDIITPITQVSDIGSLPVLMPGDKFTKEPDPIVVESSSSAIEPGPEPASSDNPTPSSSSATPKSSSSQPKSSSSAPKSSSSAAPSGGCPTIKYKSGGASGSGWATRYWDCCKPSCSWQENSGGNPARQCTNKGKTESKDWGGGSICSGGQLMTCTSQIPFTVDGCDNLGFAFAAVPASNGGQCGHCYELTFTGAGHYESTNGNTKALKNKGKKLIIMATNIGGDVQQGQFDIMIPGGGVGMFNGCSSMGWGAQGEQYGGLLSDCEKENNYAAAKMKSCLTSKCNSVFSGDSQAKEGCLFLANFLEAAGNPEHTFKEVECPDVLKQKY
jgi:hypothetical protein